MCILTFDYACACLMKKTMHTWHIRVTSMRHPCEYMFVSRYRRAHSCKDYFVKWVSQANQTNRNNPKRPNKCIGPAVSPIPNFVRFHCPSIPQYHPAFCLLFHPHTRVPSMFHFYFRCHVEFTRLFILVNHQNPVLLPIPAPSIFYRIVLLYVFVYTV